MLRLAAFGRMAANNQKQQEARVLSPEKQKLKDIKERYE